MKKFSWIFALILALSIGFIGCPAGGDDDDDDTPVVPSGPPDYVPNAKAQDIIVSFASSGAGKTQVTNRTPNGVISYPGTPVGSYKFVYGTTNDDKNSNAVNRFKVDLGQDEDGKDISLADYGKITFKWQANGFNSNASVASNKNLFLLVSEDEDSLIAHLDNDPIKDYIVNTTTFDTAPTTNLWDSAGAPVVNGNNELTITMPIITNKVKDFVGTVWFSIFVFAEEDSYTISDLKFIAGAYSDGPVVDGDKSAAPNKPMVDTPAPLTAVAFELDLSDFNHVGADLSSSGGAGSDTPVDSASAYDSVSGELTFKFTANNQRLNIPLSPDLIAALGARGNDDIYVKLEATVFTDSTTSGDLFRYHIGDADATADWNVAGTNNYQLSDLAITAKLGLTADRIAKAKYFILQHRNGNEITIKVTKITVYVNPKLVDPIIFDFTAIEGSVNGIGAATISGITSSSYTITYGTGAQYGPASYFKVKLPVGKTLADYTKMDITYTGVSGDIANKRVWLNITSTSAAPTSADAVDWTATGPIARVTANNGSNATVTRSFDFTDADNTHLDLYEPLKTLNEAYFVIYIWSGEAAWTFSAIKLY